MTKIVQPCLWLQPDFNIPSIVISGGPMLAGRRGKKDLDLNSRWRVGAVSAGMMTEEELYEIEEDACRSCGSVQACLPQIP